MKKVTMMAAMGIAALTTFAFTGKDINVPAATKEAFAKAHPGVTGKWEKEKGDYEVNFKEAGKTKSCVITGKGVILETETDIPVRELPAEITNYLTSHYKNAAINDAAEIVKSNGEVNYEAGIHHKDVLFDKAGRFIKEAKD